MKFVDIFGSLGKARRQVSGSDNLSTNDVVDQEKLVQVLRGVLKRVAALEAQAVPEATEFEVDATGGTDVTLAHGFGCPVRFYVTSWVTAGGVSGDIPGFTVNTTDTTEDKLVLTAVTDGRAIIRVEPSQYTPRYS